MSPSTILAVGNILSFRLSAAPVKTVVAVAASMMEYSLASPLRVSVPALRCKLPSRVMVKLRISAASPSLSFVSPSGFWFRPRNDFS